MIRVELSYNITIIDTSYKTDLLSSVTPSLFQIRAKAASDKAHFKASTYFPKQNQFYVT